MCTADPGPTRSLYRWVLRFAYGSEDLIPFMMLTVGIGEVLAIGVLGSILLAALNRYKTMLFGKCLATGR